MAIAFDTATNVPAISAVTSKTFAHTCTGSNLILIVAVTHDNYPARSISGITYNGVAMTFQGRATNTQNTEIWTLINPSTGANNVVISWTGGAVSGGAAAISLTGVDATGSGVGATNSATGSSNSPSVSLITTLANSWIIDAYGANNYSTNTPNGSQVSRYNFNDNDVGTISGSSLPTTTIGSYSMGWSLSASEVWEQVCIEVMAAVSVATPGQSSSVASVSFQRIVKTNSY